MLICYNTSCSILWLFVTIITIVLFVYYLAVLHSSWKLCFVLKILHRFHFDHIRNFLGFLKVAPLIENNITPFLVKYSIFVYLSKGFIQLINNLIGYFKISHRIIHILIKPMIFLHEVCYSITNLPIKLIGFTVLYRERWWFIFIYSQFASAPAVLN